MYISGLKFNMYHKRQLFIMIDTQHTVTSYVVCIHYSIQWTMIITHIISSCDICIQDN